MSRPEPTILVTGASAGAGRAIARHFGARGWRVGLVARDEQRLQEAREEIERLGAQALVLPADVAIPGALVRARDTMVEAWGDIDVWVNCAMVTVVGPVHEVRCEEYRRVTEVTYLGYVYGTLAALEHMRARNRGTIVQVGSALAYRAIPLQSAYCGAKFAVRGFTDSLRAELIHDRSRVRVTMIQMPGMNTPQFDWARNKFACKYRPVGTVHQPEVAARAVWRAVHRHPRELWVGLSSIESIVGQLVVPALMDRVVARKAWEPQLTDDLEPRGRPDNLDAPVKGSFGAHGRFDKEATNRAFMLNPQHAWLPILGAVGLALAAAIVGRRRDAGRHERLLRARIRA